MKRKQNNNTAKIYYSFDPGPRLYWKVKVKNATKAVTLNGTLAHALSGYPGSTISCHLSNCGMDKHNKAVFPHPCHLVSITPTTAYVVTKFKDGKAVEAIRYLHSYRELVELNDTKVDDKFIKSNPSLFERSFTLRPYKTQINRGGVHTGTNKQRPRVMINAHAFTHKGALRRAEKAGLITKPVAAALEQMAA